MILLNYKEGKLDIVASCWLIFWDDILQLYLENVMYTVVNLINPINLGNQSHCEKSLALFSKTVASFAYYYTIISYNQKQCVQQTYKLQTMMQHIAVVHSVVPCQCSKCSVDDCKFRRISYSNQDYRGRTQFC